jgi:anti-sigma regulatory factor (Ser/Thr protein kinase)
MDVRRLTFPGSLDQIEAICRIVEDAAQQAGFDRRSSYACQLAVGEACENIIKHGYGAEGAGNIQVIVRARHGDLTVELRDTARPFNPARSPEKNKWSEHDPPVGGLGLVIIHRVMDEVRYRRRGQENRLLMRKRVHPGAA